MPEPTIEQRTRSGGRSLRRRQGLTILLLFGGYAALYFCRADLSVGTPLIVEELGLRGLGHDEAVIRMGSIAPVQHRLVR